MKKEMRNYDNANDYANSMERTAKNFFKFIFFGIAGIGFVALFGFIVKWLWNGLVTDIFSLREITYWEGVGLLLLAKIFFGFGGSGSSSSSKKSSETPRGVISHEISKAMQEDFKKEYYRDHPDAVRPEEAVSDTDEATTPTTKADIKAQNLDEEALYDQWWSVEGEALFDSFMKDNTDA